MVGIFAHYLGSCLVSDDGDRDKNNADCDLLNYDGDDDSVGWVCVCWQDLMLADASHRLRLPPIQNDDYNVDGAAACYQNRYGQIVFQALGTLMS